MADKPLKSITFPGLSDRYTIDSGMLVVTVTSDTPVRVSGQDYYPVDKTVDECIAAIEDGRQCMLFNPYESSTYKYKFCLYKAASTIYFGSFSFGLTKLSISDTPATQVGARWAILNNKGLQINYTYSIDGTEHQIVLSTSTYTTNSLPRVIGQVGQVPIVKEIAGSADRTLAWADLPTVPTIDTSIDSSSVDTEVASAKAVYDYVQSAIGDAIGGAY